MGSLVLIEEVQIRASPHVVFGLFGRCHGAGWLFGSSCEAVVRGAVVRFALPLGSGGGGVLEGTGRIVVAEPPRRIVIRHETPWRGLVTCTIRGDERESIVRIVAEVPDDAVRWLRRRRGVVAREEADPDAHVVGLITSQSGSASMYAAASEDLARLAVDELEADGRVCGRRLRLAVGDDGTCPAVGAEELRRLIEVEGCRIVLSNVTSASFRAMEPVAADAGVLLIHTPLNEGGATSDVLVRLGERPWGQVREAIPRLMSETECRRWYLAGDDYCWPRETNRWVRRAVERAGGTVVAERYEPVGCRDFAPLLDDIERSGADLVASTFVGADELHFERQAFAAGLRDRCRTLGLPPNWYKYPAYRARMVKEPRKVLTEEFGLDLPESTTVRVWDTSAELRYWVLPQRPAGTEGMSQEQLTELVTRDSMIGVGRPKRPGER